MSSELTITRESTRHLKRGFWPSWMASIWLHALLLVVAALGLRSCTGTGDRGEADVEWRSVGLVTRMNSSDATSESTADTSEATDPAVDPSLSATEIPLAENLSSDIPPVALPESPASKLPTVIGPGSAVPQFPPAFSPDDLSGSATQPPLAPGGLAQGETQMFGVRDKGERIVYVIDVSGSMSSPPTAIAAAKSELMSSLNSLNADQQFQIIFYNEQAFVLRLRGRPPEKFYWASDINRTLARQEVAAVQPNLGTKHMPALSTALELEPDVIFFLTDAENPALNAKQLDDLRRLNRNGARLHAIEFGKGAKLDAQTALERLAAQNHGAYRYWDVTGKGQR
ncbi:MAG: hypothetical protein M3552_05815 [Planctomycetota bacterium]|nr:hypothetical protein [Planctomycetaceae bacterium]MDQ3330154.1 hypothetical protein [Planctomycetota bacterium]